MNRVFWATCPECEKEFVVDWELRHSAHLLRCPYCRHRFAADDAKALDERYAV
jgi:predicted Zn finger-like uncharacterized protein